MKPADLKGFTGAGRSALARVLERATSATVPAPVGVQRTRHAPVMLVLPWAPSVNSLYGHRVIRKGGRPVAVPYKTAEHAAYMAAIAAHVGPSVAPWPESTRLVVRVDLYRPRRIGDIDNPLKAIFDALNGRAWVDDEQVVELHVWRRDDKERPRVEVFISESASGGES